MNPQNGSRRVAAQLVAQLAAQLAALENICYKPFEQAAADQLAWKSRDASQPVRFSENMMTDCYLAGQLFAAGCTRLHLATRCAAGFAS